MICSVVGNDDESVTAKSLNMLDGHVIALKPSVLQMSISLMTYEYHQPDDQRRVGCGAVVLS